MNCPRRCLWNVSSGRRRILLSFHRILCSDKSGTNGLSNGRRWMHSSSSVNKKEDDGKMGKLRIGIVGGGAAGMSTALHLAPLVSCGMIHVVDVFEASPALERRGNEDEQCYRGSGAVGRDVGVGIWSTAWQPFLHSLRGSLASDDPYPPHNQELKQESHNQELNWQEALKNEKLNRASFRTLLQELELRGSYVADVGYRTPDGSWLVRTRLHAEPMMHSSTHHGCDPSLLFLRERHLLSCLREALDLEKDAVRFHPGVRVDAIHVRGSRGSLSTHNSISDSNSNLNSDSKSNLNSNSNSISNSKKEYDIIIAADGTRSTLRLQYGGHHAVSATGMEPQTTSPPLPDSWERAVAKEANLIEHRNYVVFRGNAPSSPTDHPSSFQTWGNERSMRFAAVPFFQPSNRTHEQVWFATIRDPFPPRHSTPNSNSNTLLDAHQRKQILLQAFQNWHSPVPQLIQSTPAEAILYETAMAHRHTAPPVSDSLLRSHPQSDPGPILVFVGDSYMTIDPVLAQGFTCAMESGASLAHSVERVLLHTDHYNNNDNTNNHHHYHHHQQQQLRHRLSNELHQRNQRREQRLTQLLRSTELVQRLGQPTNHGWFSKFLLRPAMKMVPNRIKKKIFRAMMRYSLGLSMWERRNPSTQQ